MFSENWMTNSYLMRQPRKTQPRALVADVLRLMQSHLVRLRMPKLAVRSCAGCSVSARLRIGRQFRRRWRHCWCRWCCRLVIVSGEMSEFQLHLSVPEHNVLRVVLKNKTKRIIRKYFWSIFNWTASNLMLIMVWSGIWLFPNMPMLNLFWLDTISRQLQCQTDLKPQLK